MGFFSIFLMVWLPFRTYSIQETIMDMESLVKKLYATNATLESMEDAIRTIKGDIREMLDSCNTENQKSWILTHEEAGEAARTGRVVVLTKHFKAKLNCSLRDAKDAADEYIRMWG
jgi:hypothetical protein